MGIFQLLNTIGSREQPEDIRVERHDANRVAERCFRLQALLCRAVDGPYLQCVFAHILNVLARTSLLSYGSESISRIAQMSAFQSLRSPPDIRVESHCRIRRPRETLSEFSGASNQMQDSVSIESLSTSRHEVVVGPGDRVRIAMW